MQQVRTGLSKLRKHVDAASGKSSATNKPSIGSANFLRVLETLLGGVESELMQAKRQRKESGDTLAATERKLEADVWTWEQRVASWAAESGSGADSVAVTASGATTTPRVDSRRRPGDIASTSSLLPEAVEYERFLRKHGGAYGGWDEAAHHVFLKLRVSWGGPALTLFARSALLTLLVLTIPHAAALPLRRFHRHAIGEP